jgi:hypothetical protein
MAALVDELAEMAARVHLLSKRITDVDPALSRRLVRDSTSFARIAIAGLAARGPMREPLLKEAIAAGDDTANSLCAAVVWKYLGQQDIDREVERIRRIVAFLEESVER